MTRCAVIALDPALRVVGFDEGAEAMFGFRRDEVNGEPIDLLLPELPGSCGHRLVNALASCAGAIGRRLTARRKDGTFFSADVLCARVDAAGRSEEILVVRDVSASSARGQDEVAALRAAHDELRRALREREQVLASVSHDLRTPLNVISISAGTLLRHLEGDGDTSARRLLGLILGSTRHMNRIVEDLLDVARLDAGRLVLDRGRHAAAAILAETVESLQPLAADAGVELLGDGRAGGEVLADRRRILQVLTNLVANAVKFTPAGGRVVVAAAPEGADVRFAVADTGAGIPEPERGELFRPFWQAARCDHRGAGLGLAICRALVEAHGGRIWVESAPGGGSVFVFTVPAAPASGARTEAEDLAR